MGAVNRFVLGAALGLAALLVPLAASAEDRTTIALRHFLQRQLAVPLLGSDDARFVWVSVGAGASREIVVYVASEGECGSSGCPLFILAPHGSSFRLLGEMQPLYLPVRVLTTSTHGRPDLGIAVRDGGALPEYEVRLRFDGLHYPDLWDPNAPHVAMGTGRIVLRDTWESSNIDTPVWPTCMSPIRTHTLVDTDTNSARSPDGRWEIDVHGPTSVDDLNVEASAATLIRCTKVRAVWPLFMVRAMDDVWWSSTSDEILVIDTWSRLPRLRLFRLGSLSTGDVDVPQTHLDAVVRRALRAKIGDRRLDDEELEVVSWEGRTILLAVHGKTTSARPLTFCYGVPIDTRTLRVSRLLSRRQVRARSPNVCSV
ncbi:MAG: hypothetical protein ABR975_00235 [Vulcanimicrobiaceae bacterium]|jgi:hypothetical protein